MKRRAKNHRSVLDRNRDGVNQIQNSVPTLLNRNMESGNAIKVKKEVIGFLLEK